MTASYSFLIADTYYPYFLDALYACHPELAEKSYKEQKDFIMEQYFGTGDFYSRNLKAYGHEADEIIFNNEILQRQWAAENHLKLEDTLLTRLASKFWGQKKSLSAHDSHFKILEAQIRKSRPDILYMQDLLLCPPSFLFEVKKYTKLLVGQIAYLLPDKEIFAPFDLIVSSLPHYVELFRSWGKKSEFFKIGFEARIAELVSGEALKYDIVHIGGYGPIHDERNRLLEEVASRVDVEFWGYGKENLSDGANILKNYHGECWGLDRYRVFAQSKMVISKHISSVAGQYCNIMTLYEATGCGSLLIIDDKKNLPQLFEPGKDVVTYRSADEAVEKIKYYLVHEDERQAIAQAGQQRTLSEHTYYQRMGELVQIIGRHLH
jgi:spore maturation protein CgeB